MIGRLLARGVRDLGQSPWVGAFTLASVTLVAFLAGLFLLVVHNMDRELLRSRGQVEFQAYWKRGTPPEDVRKDWAALAAFPELADMTTYSPDEALEALGKTLGGVESDPGKAGKGTDLGWLKGRNPLPWTALLSFALPKDDDGSFAAGMLERLRQLTNIERVSYNPVQVDLAHSWVRLSRQVVWPIIGFLVVVAAMIVGNTVRLSQVGRQEEVEILRLVGASWWYIRLPMLTGGAVMGVVAGLSALGLLKVLQLTVKDFLHFPPIWIKIDFLPPWEAAFLVSILTLVSILSSWAAVRE